MPQLYGTVKSRAFRVIWMLEELGAPYDLHPVFPRSDEILAVNPGGKIPAYVEDCGTVITDSTAIITYLADKHGAVTYPAGTLERAQQDAFTQLILDEFDGPLWVATKHSFGLPEHLRIEAVKDSCKWEFEQACARLDARMESDFLMGDRLTIPDIVLCQCFGWAVGMKFAPDAPNIRAHSDRMRARPAYIRARAG